MQDQENAVAAVATIAPIPEIAAAPQSEITAKPKPKGLAGLKAIKKADAPAKKGGTPELEIPDLDIVKDIATFVTASIQKKAAEGRMESVGERLRPRFIKAWREFCEKSGALVKSLKINGCITFGNPQLKMGTAVKDVITKDGIVAGLQEVFGELFPKFFAKKTILGIKASELTEAKIEGTVIFLQEKLGNDDFERLFEHSENFGLEAVGPEKDKVYILRSACITDKAVGAMVRQAVSRGLLSENEGSLTPDQSAAAAAGQEMLAKANAAAGLVSAAAAGAAAGVMSARQ